jgi:excisionase family DNA binding protein
VVLSGLQQKVVYAAISDGKLPHIRLGDGSSAAYRIKRADLMMWARNFTL